MVDTAGQTRRNQGRGVRATLFALAAVEFARMSVVAREMVLLARLAAIATKKAPNG